MIRSRRASLSYDLGVTAEVPGHGEIHRIINWPMPLELGQRVRFRHTALDPDDSRDALLDALIVEQDGGSTS